ncbi:MAG TPA: BamA/TamA family outer membrane protein [candidate division Zixibacteria bacterium]
MLPALIVLLTIFLNRSCQADGGLNRVNQGIASESVNLEGNKFFDDSELYSKMKLNGSLSAGLLEKNIERILTLYEENGFPYCQISPSDFRTVGKDRISFSLQVNEGPRVKIKAVQLDGLKTTKRNVILREMGKDIIGYFSQSNLNRSIKRIEKLSYIEEVKETELLSGENPEEGILKITLEERRNNTFSGILGYAPSSGSQKGNLVGSMNLVFDNMFGTGRRMEWDWYRKDPYSSRFDFQYRESWIFGLPPALELKTGQTDYDSTYLQFYLLTKLVFNSTQKLSWGLEGGWEKIIPGSAGKSYLPDSRKYKAGLILSLDLRDRMENPRQGIFYQVGMNYTQKRNYPTSVYVPDQLKAHSNNYYLDADNLIPFFRNQTLFAGVHFRGLNTNEKIVPLSDQYKLGGINSLRGYREEEFYGTTIGWVNLEYRFLMEGNSRFFLFTDYGYYERRTLSGDSGDFKEISDGRLGYGLGLRIDTKAGLLGLDYGLGEGDSFSQGKIHFGVINRF